MQGGGVEFGNARGVFEEEVANPGERSLYRIDFKSS